MAGTTGISFTSARHYHAGYPAKTRPAPAPLDETAVTPLKARSSDATESKGIGTESTPIEPVVTPPAASVDSSASVDDPTPGTGGVDTSGISDRTKAIYEHLMQYETNHPFPSMDAFEEAVRKTIGPLVQADGVANPDQVTEELVRQAMEQFAPTAPISDPHISELGLSKIDVSA